MPRKETSAVVQEKCDPHTTRKVQPSSAAGASIRSIRRSAHTNMPFSTPCSHALSVVMAMRVAVALHVAVAMAVAFHLAVAMAVIP